MDDAVKIKKTDGFKKEIPTLAGVIAIIIFIFLCMAGVGGFYYVAYQQDKKSDQSAEQSNEQSDNNQGTKEQGTGTSSSDFGTPTCPTTLTAAEITELATWQRRENATYNFSYYIPGDWSVFTPETSEGVPEEMYYRDADYQAGFQNLEYLLDWKASAIYHAYDQVATESLQVACSNATLRTLRVTNEPTLNLLEATFTVSGKKHQIFYFYKSVGSASLDSDFGEQFRLLLKTIELE